jgi:hypothetical protein
VIFEERGYNARELQPMASRHRSPKPPASVVVRFLDDEIMEGRVERFGLDEPNLELVFDGASNNERALVPLPSVKRVTLDVAEVAPQATTEGRSRVAIRFQDGEVLKGYLEGEPEHAPYGLTLRLLSVEADRLETLAIPYTALKALFYLKSWDSRPPEFGGEADLYLERRLSSPLVDLVSNIGQLEKLRKKGAITESEFQRKRRNILDKM